VGGPNLNIETIVSAPFGQVAYVAWRRGGPDALVIDPGFDARGLLELLERHGLRPVAILNTHGHIDHIAGNAALKDAFPEAPLIIGRNDAPLLSDPVANTSTAIGHPQTSPQADRLLDDGERLDLAGLNLEVREIPGHSPGSVVFVYAESDPPIVFGGDVLFAGSVGRTDLPGGDGPGLLAGIRAKLFNLPDSARILPGHGPETTVGVERRTNPFVGANTGRHRLD